MHRYAVAFIWKGTYNIEFYTAKDADHAEAQCREQNPEDMQLLVIARDPIQRKISDAAE